MSNASGTGPGNSKLRHVIIGAGAAGVTAAETLRHLDPQARITVLDGEGEPPYSRMAIPYYLAGQIDEAGVRIRRDPDHYRRQDIELLVQRAVAIDGAAHAVTLADGRQLPYDRLLIATGSSPNREPVEGIDLPGVHTCWTLADARAILARIKRGTRVVQMGAGFVGCIIMHGLLARGAELTVLIRSGRMVSRMMPPPASAMIQRWCEARGVKVMGRTQTARIGRAGDELRVTLTTGEVLPADIYLSVVGVTPTLDFLRDCGIAIDSGIVVDDRMHTSLPDVYAAGDVVEARDCVSGRTQINAIQPNAVEQGKIAAYNMVGRNTESEGSFACNVLDTLGLISSSFGQWQGVAGGAEATLADEANFRYLSLQFKDDVLVGASSVGYTEHIGAMRGLIQGRHHLGHWKDVLIGNPLRFADAYLALVEHRELFTHAIPLRE
jgi:NAD(P)H-nitrite reductase large subunit